MIFTSTCFIVNNKKDDVIWIINIRYLQTQKKQGSIISIIILVVVVIIGLTGYIVYDKVLSDTNADTNTEENEQEYNNKAENINEEEETTEEELDVNSAVVIDLMSMIQEPLNKAMIFI